MGTASKPLPGLGKWQRAPGGWETRREGCARKRGSWVTAGPACSRTRAKVCTHMHASVHCPGASRSPPEAAQLMETSPKGCVLGEDGHVLVGIIQGIWRRCSSSCA